MRADARRNKDQIRTAAAEVFLEEGFDRPLEDIARRAGVSIGTLYNLFGSRASLVEAVASEIAKHRLDTQLGVAQAQSDPWSRFAQFVRGLCEFHRAGPTFSADASRQYCWAARRLAVSEATLAIGEDLILAAQEDGSLREDFALDDLLRVIWSYGSLVYDQVGDDDEIRRHTRFLLDGLRVRDARPSSDSYGNEALAPSSPTAAGS